MQPSARHAHLSLLAVATVFLSSVSVLGYRAFERRPLASPDESRLSLTADGQLHHASKPADAPLAALSRK
jgi:hypothetical protein